MNTPRDAADAVAPTTSWRSELLVAASWALLVPVLLTALMAGTGTEARELAWIYVVNFIITLGIGGSVRGSYAMLDRFAGTRLPQWLQHAIALPLGVGLGTEVSLWAVDTLLPFAEIGGGRAMLWRIGAVVSAAVVLVSTLIDTWRTRALESQLARAEAERRELAAQLTAVEARIEPHFLFNALNTVASLIEEDPEQAVDAVERIASLLRRSLERDAGRRITLQDEMELARDYVALAKLRFEDRLAVDFDVPEALLDQPLPTHTLQPLLENAVRHGMKAGARLHVNVVVSKAPETISIRVEDDGRGSTVDPGTRHGVRDLEQRLVAMFGARVRIESGPRSTGGWAVEIELPCGTRP